MNIIKQKWTKNTKQNEEVDHIWSNYMRIQINLSALGCVLDDVSKLLLTSRLMYVLLIQTEHDRDLMPLGFSSQVPIMKMVKFVTNKFALIISLPILRMFNI